MSITYREPGRTEGGLDYFPDGYEGYQHPDANGPSDDFITNLEPRDSTLGASLVKFIMRDLNKGWLHASARILVTTEGWWSGYSEYTVTDTWETVVVTCPEINWERRWESVADLFKDLATVETRTRF